MSRPARTRSSSRSAAGTCPATEHGRPRRWPRSRTGSARVRSPRRRAVAQPGRGRMPAVADIRVREAVLGDRRQIAAVALATGQDEEWGGADAPYVTHLLAHGRVVVGVRDGAV